MQARPENMKTDAGAQDTAKLLITERQFLHDLATPISVILMLAEMAEENLDNDVPPEDARNCLQRMSDNVRRLRKMLEERRSFIRGDCHERA